MFAPKGLDKVFKVLIFLSVIGIVFIILGIYQFILWIINHVKFI